MSPRRLASVRRMAGLICGQLTVEIVEIIFVGVRHVRVVDRLLVCHCPGDLQCESVTMASESRVFTWSRAAWDEALGPAPGLGLSRAFFRRADRLPTGLTSPHFRLRESTSPRHCRRHSFTTRPVTSRTVFVHSAQLLLLSLWTTPRLSAARLTHISDRIDLAPSQAQLRSCRS